LKKETKKNEIIKHANETLNQKHRANYMLKTEGSPNHPVRSPEKQIDSVE